MADLRMLVQNLEKEIQGNTTLKGNQREAALDIMKSLKFCLELKEEDPDDAAVIELVRAPGTCCPEPLCDSVPFATCIEEGLICTGCNHACRRCGRL